MLSSEILERKSERIEEEEAEKERKNMIYKPFCTISNNLSLNLTAHTGQSGLCCPFFHVEYQSIFTRRGFLFSRSLCSSAAALSSAHRATKSARKVVRGSKSFTHATTIFRSAPWGSTIAFSPPLFSQKCTMFWSVTSPLHMSSLVIYK